LIYPKTIDGSHIKKRVATPIEEKLALLKKFEDD
jgi:hypothetical protein